MFHFVDHARKVFVAVYRGPRGKDEGVGGVEIARSSRRAGEPLKSGSDPLESLGR